ncbi:methionyl-tRNA formyltransferase [bacterium]|nr:methionyl-tRNA formyltransferase [bacterium]
MTPLDPLPPPPLRIVFLGTPDFAATILRGLLEGPDRVVGAFSRPDAPSGRGLATVAPPVKRLAAEHGVAVEQPRTWKDGSAVAALRALDPDLAVVAAYGRILPQEALDAPRFGCVNVHASLLPRWRGADPITRAILEGDPETGVTIMRMVLEMDAGDVLWRATTPIGPGDDGGTLEARLADLGAGALRDAIAAWREGRLRAEPQDPARVTHAGLVRREDGRVDWGRAADAIERATRAFAPWPGAVTERSGKSLKLWRARVEPSAPGAAPGTVVSLDAEGPAVATGAGTLVLSEVQEAGKRRMAAADWARGARLAVGERLGA